MRPRRVHHGSNHHIPTIQAVGWSVGCIHPVHNVCIMGPTTISLLYML